MSVPQWNADIITPDAPASDTPIATNGGLEKNQSGELGVSVDGSTVTINEEGQLEAAGGGSGETYVDIPWRVWSDTPTTWQTIQDYMDTHNGVAPLGFGSDGYVYYPVVVNTLAKSIDYQSIVPYSGDYTRNVVTLKHLSNSGGWSGFSERIVSFAPEFDPVNDVGKVLQVTANGLAWVTPA